MTLESLEDEEMEERMEEALSNVRVPTEAIGLQAHAILFAGVTAKARTPFGGVINKPLVSALTCVSFFRQSPP